MGSQFVVGIRNCLLKGVGKLCPLLLPFNGCGDCPVKAERLRRGPLATVKKVKSKAGVLVPSCEKHHACMDTKLPAIKSWTWSQWPILGLASQGPPLALGLSTPRKTSMAETVVAWYGNAKILNFTLGGV